jgi:archaellum component FlaC
MYAVLEKLDSIEKRLDVIEKRLETVEKGCTKMGNHINFVERTYEMIRSSVNYYITWSQKLPKLIDKE